ncbi:Fanconi anemia complex, subunit FancL, WD-repeat containing domain,Zinc finger, RING-type,Zinc finger [Cinara cedri]|uniref:Fanconi anemia complex, subunit FancL, WD-repeat containing domain,Zinc finger, RING-type,Zinc finger n=1 Tax=Cinara cedri TaxID=506608 RepID=A0A5E4MJF4_9HEMI|nr:Fanconi anemia complex, subunit FancL, WD-repeat containing domain,Zinc finger, RING-type,Zinc finger [Cinara cedri]
MDEAKMLGKFPFIIPSNNFKTWKGHIILLNMKSIYIEIFCCNIQTLENLEVCIPEFELSNFHRFDLKETVLSIKQKIRSLSEFLEELIEYMSNIWKSNLFLNMPNLNNTLYPDDKFYTLIEDINLYGQYVHSIDENLRSVTFNVLDKCKRDHFIKIFIHDDKYPVTKRKTLFFETLVPPVIMDSLLKINTILKLFDQFKIAVSELNDFWDLHEEICSCNVIGSYTYKDVNYKISINKHTYVEVLVDPFNPKNCPKFNLHGHPDAIKQFQQRLNEINPILIWNTENSFMENILNIFEIQSLSHYEKQESEYDTSNCCICYDELDMTKEKQSKLCDICNSLYHMACICQWLLNSGSTPMFKHLQGKCPQCESEILVAIENYNIKT